MPRTVRRILTGLLIIGSAHASVEILVDRRDDGVIVRSPIAQGNFLFRLPAAWRRAPAEDPWNLRCEAADGDARAVLRLRIVELPAGGTEHTFEQHAARYTSAFAEASPDTSISGDGARRILARTADGTAHAALLLRDGPRLYVLEQDARPADAPFADAFADVAGGFTVLDPKGPPPEAPVDPESLEAETLEHPYYRISLLKPEGFVALPVDADADEGIWTWMRRTDESGNACEIKVRVHLARAFDRSVDELAREKLEAFERRFESTRTPRRPRRTGWPAANEAYKLEMSGKTPRSDIVCQQEWRLIHHENDRIYEIEVTTYGGAKRDFRKELRAFWRSIRIENR